MALQICSSSSILNVWSTSLFGLHPKLEDKIYIYIHTIVFFMSKTPLFRMWHWKYILLMILQNKIKTRSMSQSLTLWCNKNFAPYFVRQTGSYLGSQTLIYPMIVSCTLIYLHIWYFIKKNICTHIHMYIFDITIKNIYLRIDIYILDISCPWKTKKGYLCCNIPSLCQIHPIVNIPLYVANTLK